MAVGWLLGRGVTAGCGFAWRVPPSLYRAFRSGSLTREAMVARIKADLARHQEQALREGRIDTSCLEHLAQAVAAQRSRGGRHGFVTTNWNTLIERVLRAHGQPVWHLNGSIDGPGDAFLTEADTPVQRKGDLSSHPGFRWLREATVCVVAGMSLRCAFDRELLQLLATRRRARHSRRWCVVNESDHDLSRSHALLRQHAGGVEIRLVRSSFQDWVRAGLPELNTGVHASTAAKGKPL
jgi:hypothetical protein